MSIISQIRKQITDNNKEKHSSLKNPEKLQVVRTSMKELKYDRTDIKQNELTNSMDLANLYGRR